MSKVHTFLFLLLLYLKTHNHRRDTLRDSEETRVRGPVPNRSQCYLYSQESSKYCLSSTFTLLHQHQLQLGTLIYDSAWLIFPAVTGFLLSALTQLVIHPPIVIFDMISCLVIYRILSGHNI